MPRPFRLFREYDFFGILLPGLASVIFLYMLLPNDVDISFSAGIVFVGVFAFVFGQALHSVALLIQVFPNFIAKASILSWSHRTKFTKELNDPNLLSEETVKQLRREGAVLCPGFEFSDDFEEDAYTESEASALYAFIRSYLHDNDHSRSRGIKAMYAFCRNTCVLLFGLIPLYVIYGFLDSSQVDVGLADRGFITRPGKYIEFFPNYLRFLEAVIPLAVIGGTIFLIATFMYQRYYVLYLVTDFLTVQRSERSEESPLSRFR